MKQALTYQTRHIDSNYYVRYGNIMKICGFVYQTKAMCFSYADCEINLYHVISLEPFDIVDDSRTTVAFTSDFILKQNFTWYCMEDHHFKMEEILLFIMVVSDKYSLNEEENELLNIVKSFCDNKNIDSAMYWANELALLLFDKG